MKRLIYFLLVCTLSISSSAHAATLRTVALTGQQVPGAPEGTVFGGCLACDPPVLNDAGQTAFSASISNFGRGIWSEGGGSLNLVAAVGQQTPGMPDGATYTDFGDRRRIVMNDTGLTAFGARTIEPGGIGSTGIWSSGPGGSALLARAGEQAAGMLYNIDGDVSLRTFLFNDAGQVAFQAFLSSDTGLGTGILAQRHGNLELVARSGNHAPGTPDGVNFSSFVSAAPFTLNDNGQIAFEGDLTGIGVQQFVNDIGIWSEGSGSLALVARKGSQAPGMPDGAVFTPSVFRPALNNAGQTAFGSFITGGGVDSTNNAGIWLGASDSLALVVRSGSPAPGAPSGATFASLGSPVLNDAGQVAFTADLAGAGVNSYGLWSGAPDSLALVARRGDHAPGTEGGVVFGSLSNPFVGGQTLTLNAAGQTTLFAQLTGSGVSASNDIGIWATDRSGALQLIAREGDPLEVAPGDFRTVSRLTFLVGPNFPYPTGNSDGRPSAFNNLGQLAFQASFTDGSSGIFVSNRVAVPEPSTLLLISAGVGLFGLRNRRNGKSVYFNGRAQTRVLVAFAAIGAFTQSPTTHAAEIRTVALSGWHAPGVPDGVSFNAFHFPFGVNNRTPALNNSGQTAFEASLTGNGIDSANFAGIWSEGSGSLTLVARQGSPAPGTPSGVNFGNAFESIVLNDAGRIAFYATNLTGSGVSAVNDAGVWSEGSGSLALVAREGDQAPGTSSGVNYVGFGYPVLNNAGQTAFFGRLEGSGVDSTNNNGLWSEGSGTLSLVGRSGAQAPGAPSGVTFLFDGSIRPPALNDAGQIAFRGNLTGGDSGVWSEGSGTLALVARSGMPAPGAASGVTYTGVGIPMLNDAGQTAFYAGLTGSGVDASNDQGIWSEGSGSLKLVAREAEQAPGTPSGVNFASFSIGASNHPVINNTGQTAFYAQITGAGVDGSNFNGIWLDGSDGLALVARAGDHAPGTPSGVNFNSDFGAVSSSVRMPVLNDVGQIAFVTGLTGSGVDTNNNAGIWATDRAGVLQLILRTGAQMEVALNDIRTIRSLGFVRGSGNGDGLSSGLNDSGQLAFVASFTDGSTGIFVSNRVAVPEPSTLLLIAAGVGVFALRLTTRPPFCLTPGVHP